MFRKLDVAIKYSRAFLKKKKLKKGKIVSKNVEIIQSVWSWNRLG